MRVWSILRLVRYAKPHRPQIVLAVAASICSTLFGLLPPLAIGLAVDTIVEQEDSWFAHLGIRDALTQLSVLSVFIILAWGLESCSQYIAEKNWRSLAQTLQHELRIDAYSHLQLLDLQYFEDSRTGTLLAILNEDVNRLHSFLDFGASDLIDFFTRVFAVGTSFVLLAPRLAWLAMVPIPLILWGSFAFQAHLGPRYDRVRAQAGLMSDRLANNLSGIATIKSFATEDYERDRVFQDSDIYRQSSQRVIDLSAAFQPLLRFGILIGFVVTFYLGGRAVIQGHLSVGIYGFMVYIVQDLLWPFTLLSETMDTYQKAMASVRRILGLLDTPIAMSQRNQGLPLSPIQGDICFDDITFAYACKDRRPVLKRLSLHVPAGTTIGIVGATGSGKSSLIKLLLQFYPVQSGRILIDGLNIQDLHPRYLHQSIGWVSQDVFLFHGTVAENIRYGSFETTYPQIIQAAKLAEAHEFIEQLPQGYDTIVGERGQKLSGGQRQRLAIARAILKDPPILVLDEATSAVDNETEAAIQKSLAQITQNRTTIVIAHRLSTIRRADCIYVMSQGQIVEQGTHEQLWADQGIYAGLWRMQSGLSQETEAPIESL